MSEGRFTASDGVALAFETAGAGTPVLWQHGLGAAREQPAEVFPELPGFRRITLECRGHGRSELGNEGSLSIARFAADACELLDRLAIGRVVAGGISLGAAVALRLAADHPDRVSALVLARPAWLDAPAPPNMAVYLEVARLLRDFGREGGLRRFEASPALAAVEALSPDNAASLRWFFGRPDVKSTIALLSRIPLDGPGVEDVRLRRIGVPALVVANGEDAVHPLSLAEALRARLPGAVLRVVTSKSVDRKAHVAEFRAALAAFLQEVGAAA